MSTCTLIWVAVPSAKGSSVHSKRRSETRQETTTRRSELTVRIDWGKSEIRTWVEDVFSRDMTHKIVDPVVADDRIALTEECQYPGGTNVLCSCTAEVSNGLISKQSVVQVWDE